MKNTTHRPLAVGEVIRDGDEFLHGAGDWSPIRLCAGKKLEPGLVVRRLCYDMTKVEFRRTSYGFAFKMKGSRSSNTLHIENRRLILSNLPESEFSSAPAVDKYEVAKFLRDNPDYISMEWFGIKNNGRDIIRLLVDTLKHLS